MAGRMAADQGAALPARARAPAVALDSVSITFRLADGGSYTAVKDASLTDRRRRIRRDCRTDRLWQVDPAQRRGRTDCAVGRTRRHFRRAAHGPEPAGRLSLPGRSAVSVEDGAGECRDRTRDRRHRNRAKRGRARKPGSSVSASMTSARAIRTCCPADSASAWGSCRS